MREWDAYRGVYCGICKVLGDRYGFRARAMLTYDCVFYAMLLLSLTPQKCAFEKKRCVVNPLKPCFFCKADEAAGEALSQAAALCVLLAVQKLRDDRKDRGKGRWRARLLLPFAKRPYRKAKADYPWMEDAAARAMQAQEKAEQTPGSSLDACADPSAHMLGEVFAHASGEDEAAPLTRVLYQTGYFLGRWVYLMDAADDLEKDLESGDFNPFVRDFSLTADSPPEALDKARLSANGSLNLTLSQLIAAMQLLELSEFSSILWNILDLGLPQMQRQSLFKDAEKETEP